jgi:hypothetical protein
MQYKLSIAVALSILCALTGVSAADESATNVEYVDAKFLPENPSNSVYEIRGLLEKRQCVGCGSMSFFFVTDDNPETRTSSQKVDAVSRTIGATSLTVTITFSTLYEKVLLSHRPPRGMLSK